MKLAPLKWLLLLWIAAWITAGFLWAPLVPGLGETTRVLYFHIPAAWVTVLALAWSMVHSVLYLRRRRLEHDDHAAAAAELGLMFCMIATVSGSMWAKAIWDSLLELGSARDLDLLPVADLRRLPGAARRDRGRRAPGASVGDLLGGRLRHRAVPDLHRAAHLLHAASRSRSSTRAARSTWIRASGSSFFAHAASGSRLCSSGC